ncbi:MAG TPA: site-2 protease family protein, partial [Acidimicrobiales bacterium]|nr:site-2 protease family protein [Acidimicrobiales bacterium]
MESSRPPDTAPPERQNRPWQYGVLGLLVLGLLLSGMRSGALDRSDLLYFSVLIPSIVLHEVAHGAVALLFGDRTAQEAGRLTLNPVRHIDPFWTILVPAMMLFYAGRAFGMAKPVPVNPSRMRSPRNHGLLTSLAGPATNIVLALLAAGFYRAARPAGTLGELTLYLGMANVILAAFNLLPIPPLDGSSVIERFVPERYLRSYLRLRQYSFFVFIGLFFVAG